MEIKGKKLKLQRFFHVATVLDLQYCIKTTILGSKCYSNKLEKLGYNNNHEKK